MKHKSTPELPGAQLPRGPGLARGRTPRAGLWTTPAYPQMTLHMQPEPQLGSCIQPALPGFAQQQLRLRAAQSCRPTRQHATLSTLNMRPYAACLPTSHLTCCQRLGSSLSAQGGSKHAQGHQDASQAGDEGGDLRKHQPAEQAAQQHLPHSVQRSAGCAITTRGLSQSWRSHRVHAHEGCA